MLNMMAQHDMTWVILPLQAEHQEWIRTLFVIANILCLSVQYWKASCQVIKQPLKGFHNKTAKIEATHMKWYNTS